jgi:hypothetical protein
MVVSSDQDINWKVTQGDTFTLQIEYKDPDEVAIDLTGYAIVLEVKDKPGGRILSAKCAIGNGITVQNPESGIMEITISPAKTRKFNYPRASYQIQGTDQYGENVTFLQGWFLVNAGTIN